MNFSQKEVELDKTFMMDCWIACCDQMPPEKERVLCVTKKGMKILSLSPASMGVRYPRPSDWIGESVSSVGQRIALEDVTYWMPLPANPAPQN